MADQTYRAADGYVWKNPIERPGENGGTVITIGFRVCKMDEIVGDEAAETVAELMNRGERAADEHVLRRAYNALEACRNELLFQIASLDHCGDPGRECPLQDCTKRDDSHFEARAEAAAAMDVLSRFLAAERETAGEV